MGTNGFALIARVYVPADIISRAPTFMLHGVRASHNWLDIRMKVIGYAPISSDQSWRSSNMKLGDAVYAVIHHFQLNPPSILDITDAGLKRLQANLSGPPTRPNIPKKTSIPPSGSHGFPRANEAAPGENYRQGNPPAQNNIHVEKKVTYEVGDYEVDAVIPPAPSSFLKIDNMLLPELKQVMEDRAVMETLVKNTAAVETLRELTQQIETSNVEAATANLIHEAKIEGLCTDVDTLKKDLNAKMQQYRKLEAEREAITHPPDLQEAIGELTRAKKEAYRQSEELAENWVESGGNDVSDFVKKFMEVRLLYHTRAAKAERLEHSM